ncbi:MAG: PorV/PorQ family protein, partial [Candidatus Firestonebacteria bacterium]
MKKASVLLFLLPLFLYSALNTGTSAGSFLKINVGTRSSALGGAYAGLADDNEALLLNPAGLALIRVPEISGGHIIWFSDMAIEHAQFSFPLNGTFTLGLSGIYMNNGVFDAYTSGAASDGTFTSYDAAAGLSLGIRVTDFIFSGFSIKYIMNSIETANSASYAADFGFIFQELAPGISFGVSLLNLGTPVKLGSLEEQLPMSVRAGFAFLPSPEALITVDGFSHPGEGDYNISAGVEFYIHENIVCLRAGYIYPLNTKVLDYVSGLSAGVGINVDPLAFNYAIVPNNDLGYLHRVSVSYAFGSKDNNTGASVKHYKPEYSVSAAEAAVPEPVSAEPPEPIALPAKTGNAGSNIAILKPFTSKTIKEAQRHAMFEIIKTGLVNSKMIKTVFVDTIDLLPEELNSIAVITGSIEKKDGLISVKSVLYEPGSSKELTAFTSEAKTLIDIHLKA